MKFFQSFYKIDQRFDLAFFQAPHFAFVVFLFVADLGAKLAFFALIKLLFLSGHMVTQVLKGKFCKLKNIKNLPLWLLILKA